MVVRTNPNREKTAMICIPSFDQLLARLVQADVRFVVIGGLALVAHRC